MGVDHTLVVEPQEADTYRRESKTVKLLVTPHHDEGVTVTRNFIWDYARDMGAKRYWSFDDNIQNFYRFNRNRQYIVHDGSILVAIEAFTDRYVNVPVSGMQYESFAQRRSPVKEPFRLNTRIYSNMLIETLASNPHGIPYRFETYFNEDTDLCLRMLKDGLCTILFNAFLIDKAATMKYDGGNTGNYQGDGRYKMALELQKAHPDVTTITRRWGRWQHLVDYRPFKGNKLIRRSGAKEKPGTDNYGISPLVKGKATKRPKRRSTRKR